MKTLAALLVCLFAFKDASYGQGISEKTQGLADSFARLDAMMANDRRNIDLHKRQSANYVAFFNTATDQELFLLLNQADHKIKCFAFEALTARQHIDIIEVLKKHLSDTSKVNVFSSPVRGNKEMRVRFIEAIENSVHNKVRKMDSAGNLVFDSILIFCPGIVTPVKDGKLLKAGADIKYYNRIREIAISEHNHIAYVALAKYRKQEDIPLIKSLFQDEKLKYYAVWAVSEFPDPVFYPIITCLFEKEFPKAQFDFAFWPAMYEALAQYPTAKTMELFNQTINSPNKFFSRSLESNLLSAIEKHPNKLYDQVTVKLKEDAEYNITPADIPPPKAH